MTKTKDTSHWFVIFAKPRQEDTAENNLINQGFNIFFPKLKVLKRRNQKLKERIEPMFPGYIFISLDLEEENWLKIRSTKGVNKIVEFGGKPAKISGEFIKFIKDNCDSESIGTYDNNPQYVKGDVVNISGGSFVGSEAIFQKELGKDRVELLINFASQYAKVTMHSKDLI